MAADLPDWAQQHLEEEAFLRSQLSVTESDYREAVSALVKHQTRPKRYQW
jgi:hypothetical protein